MTIKDRVLSDGSMILRPRTFTCACGSPRLYLHRIKDDEVFLICRDCTAVKKLEVVTGAASNGND